MKAFALAACFATLAISPVSAQPASMAGGNVCLRTLDINHTRIKDSRTILFYMNNGKVWQNALRNDCPGLRFNGFSYVATPPDQVCGNLQTIRSNQSRAMCMLGPFTPYSPAAQ